MTHDPLVKRTSEEVQSNTSRGNDHDPLCPRGASTKVPVNVCEPCHWFAQVRADERERCIHILSNFTARFIEDARGGAA